MATKTRGPYDKEDTDKEFLDMIDASISEDEKKAMEQRATDGAADDILKDSEEPESFFNVDGSPKEKDASADSAAPGDPLDPTDSERQELEDRGFYVSPASDETKQQVRSGSGRMGRYARRRGLIIASSIGISIGGAIFGFIFSVLPFELQNIKNVFETEIGGVKDTVLQTRSGRLYSRAFFFHGEPGAQRFDGYRERGMVATITGKNWRSNRIINEMREKGFDFEPALDSRGRFTGRLGSITGPGIENQITNQGGFLQAWRDQRAARSQIKEALSSEQFNGRSWFWRARAARTVYQRWNLSTLRGNWIADGLDRNLDSMRMKIRNALFGTDDAAGGRTVIGSDTDATQDPDTGEITQTEGTDIGSGVEAEAEARRAQLSPDAPDVNQRRNYTRLLADAAADPDTFNSAIRRSGARVLNVFGSVGAACDIKRIFTTVEVGSRILKANALAKYATLMLSAADITLTGEVDSQDIGALTSLLRTSNPNTGNNFFSSGSWQWASRGSGTVQGDIRSVYSAGGGFTGTLGGINNQVDGVLGGPANANRTCGIATNVFTTIVGTGIGLFLGGVTFGGSLAVTAAIGIASGLALTIAEAVLVPLIIDMVAGTIITGDEYGDEIAAAMTSGYVAGLGIQSSNHGMRPLTNEQLAVLIKERDRQIAFDQQEMSLYERYLSPQNHRSLTSVAALSMPASFKAGVLSIGSVLKNPLNFLKTPLSGIFSGNKSYAAVQSSQQCPDRDVGNLATDPFCNLIFGEDLGTLSILPEENLLWMLQNEYTDEDGEPLDTPNGQRYQEYLDQCVNQLDVIHINGEFATEVTNECYVDDDVAHADGTIEKISQEEAIARANAVYTFDDLYVAYAAQERDYEAPEPETAGKIYAQENDPNSLVNLTPTELQRFRAFRLDQVIFDSMTEEFTADFITVRDAQLPEDNNLIVGDPYTSSVNIPCDERTIELGNYTAYVQGEAVEMRLCAVPNLPCDSPECTGAFGIEDANGFAVVNSRVSGAWFELIDDAIAEGVTGWSVNTSFRTMANQEALWEAAGQNSSEESPPGFSAYQSGVALDFSGMVGSRDTNSCQVKAEALSRQYAWMQNNASEYGFKQFAGDASQWDAWPSEDRC